MVWSIYKDSSRNIDQWEPCYDAWYVDYDMETNHFPNKIKFLHDGDHDVYFDNAWVTCQVVNGRWAPDTERKILELVRRTYWGDFIEGFQRRNGYLEVSIGS